MLRAAAKRRRQQPLYEQFHLDEPWDSEHNCRLTAQPPAIFQSCEEGGEGKTPYLAATGPAALFAPGDDVTAGEISDEMAGVIMVARQMPPARLNGPSPTNSYSTQ